MRVRVRRPIDGVQRDGKAGARERGDRSAAVAVKVFGNENAVAHRRRIAARQDRRPSRARGKYFPTHRSTKASTTASSSRSTLIGWIIFSRYRQKHQ